MATGRFTAPSSPLPALPQPQHDAIMQLVPLQPTPVGTAVVTDGRGNVVLIVSTPVGTSVFHLPADFVDTVVTQLRTAQVQARTGLSIGKAGA